MYKYLNIQRLFKETIRYEYMSETEKNKIKYYNEKLLKQIRDLINKKKFDKALTIFISKGRDIPRGEYLYELLQEIDESQIKSNEKKLILSAQKITNKFISKDYKYVIDNTENLFDKYKSLLKFHQHDMSARLLNFYIDSYKATKQFEVAKIKIDEFLQKDISFLAKGTLLMAKYELEEDYRLLEQAYDMFIQGRFLSNAIFALTLYANRISLINQHKLNKIEKQLETFFYKNNDISDLYILAVHYYGLIIKYKDMTEYEIALNYSTKILEIIWEYIHLDIFKDILYRTLGALGELCQYLNIDTIKFGKNKERSIKLCTKDCFTNSNDIKNIQPPNNYGFWEIQNEICGNKNFKKFDELQEKYKEDTYFLSLLYLRFAENNLSLDYTSRIGYLDKSLDLIKEFPYFEQEKAHIYKVYSNIFLENKDFKRYFKYSQKYLNIISYDILFNEKYIENLVMKNKWDLLERFVYLNNERVIETTENQFLLAKALYNQNKDLDKALTLLTCIENQINEKYRTELHIMKSDLINRKCQVNFDLTTNQIKEIVTQRIVEDAIDEFIKYIEANFRKDYFQYDKYKKDYNWISKPEEKCKKDLKFFLDIKFKEEIISIEEISTGAGYIDLYLFFKSGLEIIIELKICGINYSAPYAEKGINQLKHYLHNKQSKLGYLIVFDARKKDFAKKITSVLKSQNYLIQTKFVDMRMNTQTT